MDRIRHFARHCAFAAAILSCASVVCFGTGKDYILYVGAYTTNGSKGIYAYHYDENTDRLSPIGLAAETENRSFLVVDSGSTHLYAVNETQKYRNQSSGGLTAFAIDRKTGMLKQLDEVASRGADPCFISFDRSGKYLLVANYTAEMSRRFQSSPMAESEKPHRYWMMKVWSGPIRSVRRKHTHIGYRSRREIVSRMFRTWGSIGC